MSSIRQIAASCGFSKSTVAAALRNEADIASDTRSLILSTAKRLGYRTDARVTELMSHLRVGRPSRAVCNLAWFNTNAQPDSWIVHDYNLVYLNGARERAEELGYSLDVIWTGNPRLSLPQLTNQLKSRGIRGLILPVPVDCPILKSFDWGKYATVVLGENQPEIAVNRVIPNNHRNIITACEAIHALGYRRPALMISEHSDLETATAFTSAFSRCQQKLAGRNAIPLPDSMDDTKDTVAWVKKHRPDIVIGNTHQLYDELVAAGIRVPADLAYVHLHLGPDTLGWAGIDPGQSDLGAAAVEAVLALVHRNETGLPDRPKEIALLGEWTDGWTAPRRRI